MQKTMIYLEEDTHRRLKYLALDERVSMAELIRRAIEQYLRAGPKPPVGRKPVIRRAIEHHADVSPKPVGRKVVHK